jgi:hypothetical protein
MFIFDSVPFVKSATDRDDSVAVQRQGLCLFSTPNISRNFTASSDSSLVHFYSKPRERSTTLSRHAHEVDVGQSAFGYQRTFGFVRKPEGKEAYVLMVKDNQVNYHPIAHKVVLKLHRPSKQSKGTRAKTIPPFIVVTRREATSEETYEREKALKELEHV